MASAKQYPCMGRRLRLSVVSALLVTLGACAPTISGKLETLGGMPVAGDEARVNVIALDNDNVSPQVLAISESGEFETDGMEEGRYMVEALVPGYKPMSIKLDVNKSEDVLLKLTPSKKISTESLEIHDGLDQSRGEGGAVLVPPMNY